MKIEVSYDTAEVITVEALKHLLTSFPNDRQLAESVDTVFDYILSYSELREWRQHD